MNFELLKEEWISNSEVKKILTGKKDLEFEQKHTKEHVKDFSKLTVAKVNKLKKSLVSLDLSKLKHEFIINIINILPKDIDEIKLVLSMSVIPFNDEEFQKIYECVKPYV